MTTTRSPQMDAVSVSRDSRVVALVALGGALVLFGLLAGLFLGGAAYTPAPDGLPDPGPVVGWGRPIAKTMATVFGTLTLGFLLTAAFLIPAADRDVVSRPGRRDLVIAAGTSIGWALSALATVAFTHAEVVGEPLMSAMRPEVFFTYALEIPQNVAMLVTAILALVISAVASISVRTGSAAVLSAIAGVGLIAGPVTAHGTSLGDHSLAIAAGTVHALAAAVWVGGLVAITRHGLRDDHGFPVAVRRFSTLATGAVIVLAASGVANAYTRLESATELFTTAYGWLILLKIALLTALLIVAQRTRATVAAEPGDRPALRRWLLAEVILLAVTVGVAVSMTVTAYPRRSVPLPSAAEEILGFPFPPPPSAATVILGWYPDVVFLLFGAVLSLAYGWAVWRTHKRGVRWPVGRTVAWFLGVAVMMWATSFGISGYAQVSVEWHMMQHMLLSMLVPILLVLGMPVTLAMRALHTGTSSDRGPREWVVWGVNSPVSRFVTHPLYVLMIGTVGLFGLYFTPLFGWAMGSHLGHVLMGLHFLLAGFLFYWVVLGLDPGPRTVPPWARLILLLLYVSFHAFFAVAIMMSQVPLGPEWYSQVQPPWLQDALADSVNGGGVAWAIGELPALIVMMVVAVQWARSDDRAAKRRDRQADRDGDVELAAYNARLAALARQDSQDKVT